MGKRSSTYLINLFAIAIVAIMAIPALQSCKKTTDTITTGAISSTRLRIANLSPDLLPVNLYINNTPVNNILTPYRYPTPSAYFYLLNVGIPLQIRSAGGTQSTVAYDSTHLTFSNAKFTYLITGLKSDSTIVNGKTVSGIKSIFLVDTASVPTIGQGKLRFVNASPRSVSLDVWANGVKLFSGIDYLNYSSFTALPAGNYDLKIYYKGDHITMLKELNPLTIQDSRLYTIYAHGVIGRTDTAAFSIDTLVNK